MEMCKRCKRICDDQRIKELELQLQKDKKKLELMEALSKKMVWFESALKLGK